MKRDILLFIVLLVCFVFSSFYKAISQSAGSNYIVTYTPRTAQTSESVVTILGKDDVQKTVVYYDGLGRTGQTVDIGASPVGNDVVVPIQYDEFGREVKKYLPFTVSVGNLGSYINDGINLQSSFYTNLYNATDGVNAFSKTEFEPSPLNRIIKQGAAGQAYQPNTNQSTDHSIKIVYGTNGTNEVKCWNVISDILTDNGYYQPSTLNKTTTWDENSNPLLPTSSRTDEFRDNQGRIVLKLLYDGSTSVIHYTYYIYDNFGLLRYVLPPKAFADGNFSISTEELNNLCYQYKYDEWKRMIERKLPGAGWTYLIYDQRDRLVLEQDAKLRLVNANKYHYTIYDTFNRPVEQGISTESLAYQSGTDYPLRNAVKISTSYTPASKDAQVYTCYDNYSTPSTWGAAYSYSQVYSNHAQTNNVLGLVTGIKSKVLGTTDTWVYTVNYYEKNGKLIQSYQSNPDEGYTRLSIAYNFTWQPIKQQQYHLKSINSTPVTTEELLAYDHSGRLISDQYSYNGSAFVTIKQDSYDETGQLSREQLHNGLQQTDYQYNIRGWLSKINDPDAINNSKLFAMQLYYDTDMSSTLTGEAQYNGNVNGIRWRNWNNGTISCKGYNFVYDGLNRLKQGDFGNFSGTWNNISTYDLTTVGYDQNGNISSMVCKNSAGNDKENLTYSYTGNQLNSVTGTYGSATGQSGTFSYDANGNLVSDGLRGLSAISYFDEINLPREYMKNASNKVDFQYDALGTKWSKTATISGSTTTITYDGSFIYQGGTLMKVLTPVGFYDVTLSNHHYFLKDHLGNNRITFYYNGTTPVVEQESEYYPFGGLFAQNNLDKNTYLYNGKELNNEFFENYDYGARFYDPTIGRWHTVDPLAEKYPEVSPYNYCANNPMIFVDPDGRDWVYRIVDGNTEVYYDRDVKSQADVINKYGKDAGVSHMSDGSTLTTYDKDGNVTSKYTFTNDSKENKYGTVTDINGDKLDNTQIKYGSNYTIFGTSDNSANAETLHKNMFDSSYIGPDNPKDYNGKDSYQYKPIWSPTEMAAFTHDLEYDALGAKGVGGALSPSTKCADVQLIYNCKQVLKDPNSSPQEKSRAKKIIAGFSIINFFKPMP